MLLHIIFELCDLYMMYSSKYHIICVKTFYIVRKTYDLMSQNILNTTTLYRTVMNSVNNKELPQLSYAHTRDHARNTRFQVPDL